MVAVRDSMAGPRRGKSTKHPVTHEADDDDRGKGREDARQQQELGGERVVKVEGPRDRGSNARVEVVEAGPQRAPHGGPGDARAREPVSQHAELDDLAAVVAEGQDGVERRAGALDLEQR